MQQLSFFIATMSSSSLPAADTSAVVLDALPYIDVIHEDYEAYALALVEQEMAKILPKPLAPIGTGKMSEILQTEYNFVAAGKERPTVIDSDASHTTPPESDNVDEWKDCIKKARAAHEAERLRSAVLELESTHAPDQWKHYTSAVLLPLEQQESALYAHQQSILEEIHAQRQQEQVEAAKTLQLLQQQYHDLIQKRHYLQMATLELEEEVNRMKTQLSGKEGA